MGIPKAHIRATVCGRTPTLYSVFQILLDCIVCISNGSLNLREFILTYVICIFVTQVICIFVTHIICIFATHVPIYALVGEIKLHEMILQGMASCVEQ